MEKPINERYVFVLVFFITVLSGMHLSLMDIDASQYASISKEMFYNKSYLEIYCRGLDYLDKPPMLFWTSVLSFKIFGIHEWSYRLPSVLISILGLFSLFKFSRLYYPTPIAFYSVMICASSQAFFLMSHDVRTDTMLCGFLLFSLWQLSSFFKFNKPLNLYLGTIGIAFAMMTKGPIGLIAPVIIIGVNLIYTRKLKLLLDVKLLYALLLLTLLLFPMSYGLYTQFDLHPEKKAYGLKGPSGIRFYYWIQSFGRITHESNWDNNPEPLFLVHSFLWSFLPWPILYLLAIIKIINQTIKKELRTYLPEFSSIGGFLILFLIMSLSSYQLPHYTFFIHPLAAITLSHFIYHFKEDMILIRRIAILQFIVFIVLGAVLFYLNAWAFPNNPFLFNSIVVVALIYNFDLLFFSNKNRKANIIWSSFLFMAVCNFILNTQVYPSIFQFQANEKIADYMNKNHANAPLHIYKTDYWYSCDFKLKQNIQKENQLDSLLQFSQTKKLFIMTNEEGLTDLKSKLKIKDISSFKNFPVSNLSLEFINPYKRNKTISYLYLVETN